MRTEVTFILYLLFTHKIKLMALLNVIEKDQATGKVASIYENMINAMGFVPNAFKP